MNVTLKAIRDRKMALRTEAERIQQELADLDTAERVILGLPQKMPTSELSSSAAPSGQNWLANFIPEQASNALTLGVTDRFSLTNKLLAVLQTLAGSGAPPVNAAELSGLVAHHFGEAVDQRSVTSLLSRLAQRGDIERASEGRYRYISNSLTRSHPPPS
jgi:hypothetical protein